MEYLFFWLLCSGVVGIVAMHGRGRNGGGWFLLSLLISPLLALILVLCLPAQAKRLTRRQIVEQLEHLKTLRECPFCAETVKLQAKVCKHCHSELPAPVIKIQPIEQPRRERLIEW
jgi:hypothetical protein